MHNNSAITSNQVERMTNGADEKLKRVVSRKGVLLALALWGAMVLAPY